MAVRSPAIAVVPGEEAVYTAVVRNTGSVVDQVSFDVVGPAAAWSVIEPPVLNLYPGDSGEVRVHFRPPRASEPAAGAVPFGLRATSREDPHGSMVEEGVVEVAPFTDLRVTLLPQISRGGRRGRHKIDVSNLGNVAVGTEIIAVDPDDELKFSISRPTLLAGPGVVTRTKLVAVPRRTFLTGGKQDRPFEVLVQPERGETITIDGTFEQESLVPRWLVIALVALLGLAVLLGTLWFTLVKPAVRSAATEAAQVEASKAAAVQDARRAAEEGSSGGANGGATGGSTGATPTPAPTPAATGAPAGGAKPMNATFEFFIQANATPQTSGFRLFSHNGQGSKPIDITDIQLQNPAGDSGRIQLRRGTDVIYTFGLDNFMDFDVRRVVPLHYKKNQKFYLAVQCRNPAPERRPCTAAVTISGKTTS